jgi:hypothetical protein
MDQPRSRPVPTTRADMSLLSRGLGWHGDPRASRAGAPVVGAPPSSERYASSLRHGVWGRGIPNAARPMTRTGS